MHSTWEWYEKLGRNSDRSVVMANYVCMYVGLNHVLSSYKPTDYLLNYGDYTKKEVNQRLTQQKIL